MSPGIAKLRDGVGASRLQLPPGDWATVLDALVARFPAIARDTWLDRMARGRVCDGDFRPIDATTAYRVGAEIRYWREVADEPRIDAIESVLHVDEHLVVADKPHGLPVMPGGEFVAETLLARLIRRLRNPQLVPLHRIDRDTAGLVMFSAQPGSRAGYHALFHDRRIEKRYEAIASPLPDLAFPLVRCSRLERGVPFFRRQEGAGAPNSETHVDVLARGATAWRYSLRPITGRSHQLRVHMAALGAPIRNDVLYPEVRKPGAGNLQLVARSLAFIDPIAGCERQFESAMRLEAID